MAILKNVGLQLGLLLLIALPCLGASSERELDPDSQLLYRYIVSTQRRSDGIFGTRGFWETTARISGTSSETTDVNSFLTLQALQLLYETNQFVDLPEVTKIYVEAEKGLDPYFRESAVTHEPPGTLNFWRILYDRTRGPNPYFLLPEWFLERNGLTRNIMNLPNDLDTSADAFKWYRYRNSRQRYRNDFIATVSDWVDKGRDVQARHDDLWKSRNSGAFLTWAEKDAIENPRSQIPLRVNDVDCIVNLNILSAVGAYTKDSPLSRPLREAVENSCRVLNQAVAARKTDRCAVYYDRLSQFFLAYSKAREAGVRCLESSQGAVLRELRRETQRLLNPRNPSSQTEMAETLLAVKSMIAPETRNSTWLELIQALERKIRVGVPLLPIERGYLNGNSLFIARLPIATLADSTQEPRGPLVEVRWFSPAFTAILTLKALNLP